jgi:high-affinity nickel-transport protein
MIVPVEVLTGSGFGTLLGVRHALEPDHLAAVSTLVNEERSSARAVLLGVSWGVGHTASLLIVGTGLILIRADLPVDVAEFFELAVALMMLGLGVRALSVALRRPSRLPGPLPPADAVPRDTRGLRGDRRNSTLSSRPLVYGLVHGLAGSGALTALVLTTLPTTAARLTYMMLFGIGSTLGMAVLSGLLGWPLARLSPQCGFARTVSALVGCLSAGLGLTKGYALLGPFVW